MFKLIRYLGLPFYYAFRYFFDLQFNDILYSLRLILIPDHPIYMFAEDFVRFLSTFRIFILNFIPQGKLKRFLGYVGDPYKNMGFIFYLGCLVGVITQCYIILISFVRNVDISKYLWIFDLKDIALKTSNNEKLPSTCIIQINKTETIEDLYRIISLSLKCILFSSYFIIPSISFVVGQYFFYFKDDMLINLPFLLVSLIDVRNYYCTHFASSGLNYIYQIYLTRTFNDFNEKIITKYYKNFQQFLKDLISLFKMLVSVNYRLKHINGGRNLALSIAFIIFFYPSLSTKQYNKGATYTFFILGIIVTVSLSLEFLGSIILIRRKTHCNRLLYKYLISSNDYRKRLLLLKISEICYNIEGFTFCDSFEYNGYSFLKFFMELTYNLFLVTFWLQNT